MCLTAPWERDLAAHLPRSAHHPFVANLGAGRVPARAVRRSVGPDRYDRQVFQKAHALAQVRAADERREAWEWLVETLPALAEGGQVAHRNLCRVSGVTETDAVGMPPIPTVYAFAAHLLVAAQAGGLRQGRAALLPCYGVSVRVAADLPPNAGHPYRGGSEFYQSPARRTRLEAALRRFDRLGARVDLAGREGARRSFRPSLVVERFFRVAWSGEDGAEVAHV